ncbi:hypothetical protein APP90_22110 [Salmonella enterica subsp. enterica serovar Sandiego]|nr:hypothetical protein [Salmonella enterica subsp. enterica serovar Oranienburg]EAY2166400.1 hypothetical protein [Salmonella enterica]EBE1087590.1 hypothetical protein [Salmonella enterica]ECC9953978.1 hypothetical protein [Salmonella enterica subsp. enterica]OIV23372.1 hypothetical protein APP90_22110 [Salmonella enterica subsp. enterica serovar Sandiego]
MHSQLKERIRLMRARLDNAAPVAEIRAESQLFVTPAPVCDRLMTQAGGRINARLPVQEKDRAPVALKGAALTRRPFHYADILLCASVSSCLSFICY